MRGFRLDNVRTRARCVVLQAREEVFHAQLVAMSTQSGPGGQSSDLLDDSELMTDDRELDADLVGTYTRNGFTSDSRDSAY